MSTHEKGDSRQIDYPPPEPEPDQQEMQPKVSCCAQLRYVMGLFLETFKKRYHSDKNLEQVLLVRAWVLHCIISINRLSQLGTKNSMVLDVQCENCPPYNQELLDSRHKYFRYIVIALTAIGVLIDILAVKWRSLAHCFIYLEQLLSLFIFFIPTRANIEMPSYFLTVLQTCVFIFFYCGTNLQLVISLLSTGL